MILRNEIKWFSWQLLCRLILFPTLMLVTTICALFSPNIAANLMQYIILLLSTIANNIRYIEAELEGTDDEA